jgi:hypothetical protein
VLQRTNGRNGAAPRLECQVAYIMRQLRRLDGQAVVAPLVTSRLL